MSPSRRACSAGRWQFTAEAEGEGFTTDQRPFFRLFETWDARRVDVSTPMAAERMTEDFTVPARGN